MAKKHQIVVSSKKGRSAAGRKWRRQAKERLEVRSDAKGPVPRQSKSRRPKDKGRKKLKTALYRQTISPVAQGRGTLGSVVPAAIWSHLEHNTEDTS